MQGVRIGERCSAGSRLIQVCRNSSGRAWLFARIEEFGEAPSGNRPRTESCTGEQGGNETKRRLRPPRRYASLTLVGLLSVLACLRTSIACAIVERGQCEGTVFSHFPYSWGGMLR